MKEENQENENKIRKRKSANARKRSAQRQKEKQGFAANVIHRKKGKQETLPEQEEKRGFPYSFWDSIKAGGKERTGSRNKELVIISYMFIGLFICLMGYFAYFQVFKAEDVINSSYNARQDLFGKRIVRGSILAKNGEVLAESKVSEDGTETRNYPYGNLFSHIVGYSTKGKSGVESLGNFNLLRSHAFFLERLVKEFKDEKNIGDSVVTTLDYSLQKAAYDALGDKKGAVVVMEPSTGKILAMVSKPDFNPNEIDSIWESLVSDDSGSSVLLNRALQGLYPPGSIFKILTTMAALSEDSTFAETYSYDCTGILQLGEDKIGCYGGSVHGPLNLDQSFAKSCNTSFANIGLELESGSLREVCESMLFNKTLPISLPYKQSSFEMTADAQDGEIMQTAIGQGKTQVTPFHMALLTCAIANGGNLMTPYLIDHTENYTGTTVKKYMPSQYKTLISGEMSEKLRAMMTKVVSEGTASKLSGLSHSAAGKTGTAEYSSDKSQSHAWFVGFAPAETPELVISVIVEESGAGSEYAVPVAKAVFDTYFANKQ